MNETQLLKTKNAISLFEMDIDELKTQRKQIEKVDKQFARDRKKQENTKKKDISKTEDVTEDKLDKRAKELVKLLDQKEENSRADFERKEKVLKSNFSLALGKLIQKVKF